MKLALDATYSMDPRPSGVAVYSRRLIAELMRIGGRHRLSLFYRPHRFLAALPRSNHRGACKLPLSDRLLGLMSRFFSVFHGLNQRLPRCRLPASVATFHDLFVLTAEYSTPEFRRRFAAFAQDAAGRADVIIAVSDHTRRQVVSLLGRPGNQVTVVPHGVDPPRAASPEQIDRLRRRLDLRGRFLLHVGALQERKNILRLLTAFEQGPKDLDLVLAGSSGFGAAAILERIARSPARERIRHLGYVDDFTRAALLRSATALAFPSLDEGFGLPVLEAMAAGLPVLTSNRSALPEVAGDAAVLVDPFDVDAIREGLTSLTEDEALQGRLREAGLRRAAQFTWERTALSVLKIYESVASGPRSRL